MAEKLNHDPELCEKLIPKFEVGCRRVTPGQGYLESFSLPNCNLSNSTITHISENAVHTADGKAFECDVGMFFFILLLIHHIQSSKRLTHGQSSAPPASMSRTFPISQSSAKTVNDWPTSGTSIRRHTCPSRR